MTEREQKFIEEIRQRWIDLAPSRDWLDADRESFRKYWEREQWTPEERAARIKESK